MQKNAMMYVASCSNSNGPASWVGGTWIPPNNDKKGRLSNMPDILYFSDLANI